LRRLVLKYENDWLSWHEKRLKGKVHTSIDTLPILNWRKIHATRDYTWLYLTKVERVGKYTNAALKRQWERVYDGYIERFGLSAHYLKMIDKFKEIAQLKVERMQTGDRKLNTFIKIAELELAEIEKGDGLPEVDFYESKSHVEQQIGFALDQTKTTVAEYYSHIKVLKEQNQRQKG
jgi:hypothetical protein